MKSKTNVQPAPRPMSAGLLAAGLICALTALFFWCVWFTCATGVNPIEKVLGK